MFCLLWFIGTIGFIGLVEIIESYVLSPSHFGLWPSALRLSLRLPTFPKGKQPDKFDWNPFIQNIPLPYLFFPGSLTPCPFPMFFCPLPFAFYLLPFAFPLYPIPLFLISFPPCPLAFRLSLIALFPFQPSALSLKLISPFPHAPILHPSAFPLSRLSYCLSLRLSPFAFSLSLFAFRLTPFGLYPIPACLAASFLLPFAVCRSPFFLPISKL